MDTTKMIILDVCRVSDTEKVLTIELYEGHWPSEQVFTEMYKHEGWEVSTITDVQSKIKLITLVREV